MVNVPLVIWASDVWWRVVDVPSVRFARWVEERMVVGKEGQSRETTRDRTMRV
jgi:hypothetical protein